MILGSVRNRLAALFFVITAAAVGFMYLYVVPQLRSNLTAQKLQRLEQVANAEDARLDRAMRHGASQAQVRRLVKGTAQRADARVTVLGVPEDPSESDFVIADSELERTAILPSYPAATAAVTSGRSSSAIEDIAGQRTGEIGIPLTEGGHPKWVVVLSTPIPDEGQDEVGQLASTFNEMQQRLARLDSARKEFIANASHELRTPIFSLGGFVELLDEDEPDPAVRAEFVRTMRQQIARLTKLTADLLDLSKLDADVLEVRADEVELESVARRVAEEFDPVAEQHRSTIAVEEDGGAVASADADRVAQIIRILLDNALTHTPEGTSISITAHRRDGAASLVVADNGPGIAPQDRTRVFDRFYTGDRVSGSGLGLAIARELAIRMHGELGVDSRRGRTRFELRLPESEGVPA